MFRNDLLRSWVGVSAACIVSCCACLFLAACLQKQFRGPKQIVAPSRVDFGKIQPVVVDGGFELQNQSADSVEIFRVETSCGCTVPGIATPRVLQPAEVLHVPLRLDATRLSGHVEKTLKFWTSSVAASVISVSVIADVSEREALVTHPEVVSLGRFGAWEPPRGVLSLVSSGPRELVVHSISEITGQEVKWDRVASIGHGGRYHFDISRRSVDGPFSTQIRVCTSHGNKDVAVDGTQVSCAYVDPSVVVFSESASSKKSDRFATVYFDPCIDPGSIIVESGHASLSAAFRDSVEAGSGIVAISLNESSGPLEAGRGVVVVKCFSELLGECRCSIQVFWPRLDQAGPSSVAEEM